MSPSVKQAACAVLEVHCPNSSMFSVVVGSMVVAWTDFQCNPSFPHLGLDRCVYCGKVIGGEEWKMCLC